jgi:hypothetical protein
MPGTYLKSSPVLQGEVAAACQTIPSCQRERVYVFFVNGLDPLHRGKLDQTREYVERLGFARTYLGEMYDCRDFENEIRRIHREQPDARFVLVGFSFGANLVKVMAHALEADGIDIDLLAYIGGDTLQNTSEYRPAKTHRILNVTGRGCPWLLGGLVFDGVDIDGADNLRLAEAGHYEVPTDPKTLELLACGLGEVAARASSGPAPLGESVGALRQVSSTKPPE